MVIMPTLKNTSLGRPAHAASDGAEQAHWHDQQDGNGRSPALVERGEAQEYDEDRQTNQHRYLGARELLLERLGRPTS